MMRAGAYPVQVKLSYPLWLLSQWEEMAVAELLCHLEVTEVAVAELLAQYEEMAVTELPCPLEATEVTVAVKNIQVVFGKGTLKGQKRKKTPTSTDTPVKK
jgi:hypothetical protein